MALAPINGAMNGTIEHASPTMNTDSGARRRTSRAS
jgi:hypothetical protein